MACPYWQDVAGDLLMAWKFLNCFSDMLGLDVVSLSALDAALSSSCDPASVMGQKQAALLSGVHIALVRRFWC